MLEIHVIGVLLRHVRKIAEIDCYNMSVRPRTTTRLPLDRFSYNLTFEYFLKSVENIQVSLKSEENNDYFP